MDNSNLHQPERLKDETFEQYKMRRNASNKLNKIVKHGIPFWNSREKGTFRKSKEN